MGLVDRFRKTAPTPAQPAPEIATLDPATAIHAIPATDDGLTGPAVAGIATVAVANPASEKTDVPRSGGHLAFREQYARAREASDGADLPDGSGEQYARAREPDDGRAASRPNPMRERFDARVRALVSRGMLDEDAEALALRLRDRDRDLDDRRMCVECSYFGSSGRCLAAAAGKLPGASPRLEPVPNILQRCEAFGLRKGLD